MKNEDTPKFILDILNEEREKVWYDDDCRSGGISRAVRDANESAKRLREMAQWYVSQTLAMDVSPEFHITFTRLVPIDFLEFIILYEAIAEKYADCGMDANHEMKLWVDKVYCAGGIPNVPPEELTMYLREMTGRGARLFCEELLEYSPACCGEVALRDLAPIRLFIENATGEPWELDNYTRSDWARIPEFFELCKQRELNELLPPAESHKEEAAKIALNQDEEIDDDHPLLKLCFKDEAHKPGRQFILSIKREDDRFVWPGTFHQAVLKAFIRHMLPESVKNYIQVAAPYFIREDGSPFTANHIGSLAPLDDHKRDAKALACGPTPSESQLPPSESQANPNSAR